MDLRKSKSMRCQTDVALSITNHLFSKQEFQDQNLVFSPFSLHVVLSVMAAGSDGCALNELLSFLRADSVHHLSTFFSQLVPVVLSDVVSSAHRLSFVNGLWVDNSLSLTHSFKQLVATHYKATLDSVDFQSQGEQVRHDVNMWVQKETRGLIKELLPPGTAGPSTKLIFANALHFKGAWKHKFDASRTIYDKFRLLDGSSVRVPFMRSNEKERFKYISTFDGFKVLRLSCKQGTDKKRRFSMYIFLPDAKNGLPALIERLASESGFLKGKFPRRKAAIRHFRIPKFDISFELEASHVLMELGVVSPFSSTDADFTKMVEVNSPLDELLYADSVFHKAFIKVDEEGTTAAAATAMLLASRSGPSVRAGIDFVADHPFFFLIREDFTGTILFIGQVLHPNVAAKPSQ
ncbi:serpin-ZX-like [Lotus japonicus]|uniref:serpin-ZX-like n=1 Tax=Lotus japonicus TaxID=34305 RepID=UPI00258DC356|nr:serpin-ZX-like [Lotus japonicus]XP_057419323.1 serpin-ZX-like [Lotus japonicus]XP_057419324.1 serpin-ZX-like [Lotus japonicus]